MESYIGHGAGIATSLLWAATSLLFTAAGHRLGSIVVNGVRLGFAVGLLGITHWWLTGHWIPEANARQVLFLALSGVVGLTIGDQALFTAFITIGPRISTLVMTSAPVFAALFGSWILGEDLGGWAWLGMALTIAGIAWVVFERPRSRPDRAGVVLQPAGDSGSPTHRSSHVRGVVLAVIGAICQAGGLLLSKQGMGHGWLPREEHLSPQTATLIRMTFAAVGIAPLLVWHARGIGSHAARRYTPRVGSPWAGMVLSLAGAVTGPFLGVWMSLVASDRVPLGVAQTLCSMTPIFVLPAIAVIHGERITARAVVGAVLAVAGVSLLFVGA